MIDFIYELPRYDPYSGGVQHTIGAAKCQGAHVRFQALLDKFPPPAEDLDFSVGLPDESFPECRYAVTYSDTPHMQALMALPQVGKVGIWVLGYERGQTGIERANVVDSGAVVMSSTTRTRNIIERETGVPCTVVGFGFDADKFGPVTGIERKRYAALFYHPHHNKRYEVGVKTADRLYDDGHIDGVLTFGRSRGYGEFIHPKALVKNYPDAVVSTVRALFSKCRVFIMPSVNEGLNRTPAEAALCGCPPVLCDGALYDLYSPGLNCTWVSREYDGTELLYRAAVNILEHDYSAAWMKYTEYKLMHRTWPRLAGNIRRVMGDA